MAELHFHHFIVVISNTQTTGVGNSGAGCLYKYKTMIIDLSSNNGIVDFSQLTGVDEVFIRASLGYGDHDKNLQTNATMADAVGTPVSYYHFAYPDTKTGGSVVSDARNEAEYFAHIISNLPKPKHVAVDLEDFSKDNDTPLSQVDYELWLQTFLDTVEKTTGIKPMIYSYADYLNRHLPADHTFGTYDLWIANYGNVEQPALPIGWDKYYAWQYSENGIMSGIEGKVDFSKTA